MLEYKNTGILIKKNSKMISSYDMLRPRLFRARRKFLRARYTHAYQRPRNFLRPRKGTLV